MIVRIPLNRILAIFCLCLLNFLCPAQDKAKNMGGKISPADFTRQYPASLVDSNTTAIVLSDEGSIHYVGNKNGWFSYVYTRHTRIHVLDKKAFNLAKVSIRLDGAGEYQDKLSGVEAVAYNLESGQVVQTRMSDKDVFRDRLSKETTDARFSLPGVKEGSIIEYGYTIQSEFWKYLPSWQFQWQEYPCLFSQYQVEIPKTLGFVIVRQGAHSYVADKGSEGSVSYKISHRREAGMLQDEDRYYTINTVKHVWDMKNIPAFGTERFLTTPENYVDKIDFQLAQTNDGETSEDETNSWAKATDELLTKDYFGAPLQEDNEWLNDLVEKIPLAGTDESGQARAIYYYISHRFTCTDHYNKFIETTLRDVVRTNKGTVGDINLLLVAILRKKGFTADPVLLSTREFGFNLASYPVLQRLNYVIVRLKLGKKIYYLDAAQPQLGFGQLSGNCYNGHARIISKTDSGSVYFWADSLKEKKTTMVLLTSTEKGMEGTLQSTLGPEESYQVRQKVSEKGVSAIFKDIQTNWGEDMEISNGGIDSLDRPEDPVNLHYEFLLKQAPAASVLYFTPMLGEGYRENPFKSTERKYPVEMPYAIDETYVLSMEIPDGYVVDEIPKSAKVAFNGDQGYFEYLVQAGKTGIQMRCRVKLNKALFLPEDYSALRDFFGFIVKKQNEPIVLKKK